VNQKRVRANLADDMASVAGLFRFTLNGLTKYKGSYQDKSKAIEYLWNCQEYTYWFFLHALDRIIDAYYTKKASKEALEVSRLR